MDWKSQLLVNHGYQVVWMSEDYCCACRDGRDVIFRWSGERWVVRSI
ncbi:hypothetical protein Pan216_15060 [Planctomycetes bacterium Pan216]|uniref:Uncharacterized protein n=1 Tax=Kolteria novifilia TaxID=2527975 RepID=A0A518B103_9BACT|nr:hypothetical protein Pan216_15060 [Planctomycetes bacterium Pan216]